VISGLSEQEHRILHWFSAEGTASIAALSKALGVSEVTIRPDLKNFAISGWINRQRKEADVSPYFGTPVGAKKCYCQVGSGTGRGGGDHD
jgi:predicted ArsR family transcriptional regulator